MTNIEIEPTWSNFPSAYTVLDPETRLTFPTHHMYSSSESIHFLSLSLSIAVRSPGPWFILASVLQIYCPLGKGFYAWILRLECQPKSFRKLQRTKIPRWDVVNIAKVGGKPVINICWYLLDDSQLLPSNNLYIYICVCVIYVIYIW